MAPVSSLVRILRFLAIIAFLGVAVAASPVFAQKFPNGPSAANPTNPNGRNPTAESVNEEALFKQVPKLDGRVSIPDRKAAVLEQPQGRDWRRFHEAYMPWIAGIAILGITVLLGIFYFTKGRIMMDKDHSQQSGQKIKRFNAFERFTHWLTAASFIVLAISGLNYIYGKRLLQPILGPDAFTTWSIWAKVAHNFVAWPFMLGVLFMFVLWVRDNVPSKIDIAWLRAGGGMFGGGHPHAGRFNAGQKIVFWTVAGGGLLMSVTGIALFFPFYAADINGMQVMQGIHSLIAAGFIAAIIAHIYIGTLGMEGAYDAMSTGEVDLAWAKAHHDLWVDEVMSKGKNQGGVTPQGSVPAE